MASRFWVGGSGNWDASTTTNWSATSGGAGGASVPTSADSVTFDGNSGTAATVTVTAAANAANVTINKSDLTLLLNAGLTIPSSGTMTLTTGTLNTNGQTCSWGFFNSSSSGTRTLTLGASAITLTGGSGVHWDFGNPLAGTLTFNPGTSTITINFTSTWTFNGGGKTFYNLVINSPGGQGNGGFRGNNTFNNLTYNCTSGNYNFLNLSAGSLQTVTGTFTINGSGPTVRMWCQSDTPGTSAGISAATTSLSYADFMDIAASGAAAWTGTSLGNGLGNSGITFTTARTLYRVGAGGNWLDTTHWSLTSGGASGQAGPLAQDSVFIDGNASGTIGGALTTQWALAANIDFTGFTGTEGFGGYGNEMIFGNLKLASGMTMGGSESYVFAGRGAQTITSAGKSLGSNITFQAPGGSYTLQDAFVTTGNVTHNIGGLSFNNFNFTCSTFTSNNSLTRSLTLGTGTITLTGTGSGNVWNCFTTTGLTFSGANATITISTTSTNQRVFDGGNQTYGTLNYTVAGSTGALRIGGANTFGALNFSDASNARTLTLGATLLNNVANFNVVSTGAVTVNSSTPGTAAQLQLTGTYSFGTATFTDILRIYVKALSYAAKAAMGRVNFLTNPGFENGVVGYNSGVTLTADTIGAQAGSSGSAKFVSDGNFDEFHPGFHIPVVAGQSYLSQFVVTSLAAHTPNAGGSNQTNCLAYAVWYDNTGATLSQGVFGSALDLATIRTGATVGGVVTAPAGAVSLQVYIYQYGIGTAYYDNWIVTIASSFPQIYFDGSYAGASWDGTANASSSHLNLLKSITKGLSYAAIAATAPALKLDGISNNVSVPTNAVLVATTGVSFGGFVRFLSLAPNQAMGGRSVNLNGYLIELRAAGIQLEIGNGSNTYNSPQFMPTLGRRYRVIGTFDGVNISLWVDGALIGTTVISSTTIGNSGGNLYLGRYPGSAADFANMVIDNAFMMNRAMTSGEVAADYAVPGGSLPTDGSV